MKTTAERKITKKDLAKYSKAELIEILSRLVFHIDPFQRSGYLERAMVDVKYDRQMARIDKAHEHATRSFELRTQANALLKPYEGKRLSDVPKTVLDKVAEYTKQAEREEAAWEKLSKEIEAYGKET